MSVQLRPQQSFTVVRQIANHLDSATYYVRAVIRNAYTDDILATLNLDDKGSQRFKKDWQVSADPSGQGFYLSIVTSVYTDSGYTTKSENYGDEENTYLVAELPSAIGRGSGGVDARTIRRIVKEEIELAKPEEVVAEAPPTPEPMRWDEVISEIQTVKEMVGKVPTEKVDLSDIMSGMDVLLDAVTSIETTPETDLSPVLGSMEMLSGSVEQRMTALSQMVAEYEEQIGKEIGADVSQKLEKLVRGIKFSIAPTSAKMEVPVEKEPDYQEMVQQPFDINKLTA